MRSPDTSSSRASRPRVSIDLKSNDERRLTGDFRDRPDATPIGNPDVFNITMPKPSSYSIFTPCDTLNSNPPFRSLQGSKLNAGRAVPSRHKQTGHGSSSHTARADKGSAWKPGPEVRQGQHIVTVDAGGEDPLETSSHDSRSYLGSHIRNFGSGSRRGSASKSRQQNDTGIEFRKVEKRMKAGSGWKRKHSGSDNDQNHDITNILHNIRQTKQQPVDLFEPITVSDDDNSGGLSKKEKTLAASHGNSADVAMEMKSAKANHPDTSSPYFRMDQGGEGTTAGPSKFSTTKNRIGPRNSLITSEPRRGHIADNESGVRLHKKFKRDDTLSREDVDVESSIDELQSADPLHSTLNQKESRLSHTGRRKAEVYLPSRADIPPSTFTSSNPKAAQSLKKTSRIKTKDQPPSWGILSGRSCGVSLTGSQLQLTFDEDSGSYLIDRQDPILVHSVEPAIRKPLLTISPKKINSGKRGGSMIRLGGSKTREGTYEVDLRFQDDKSMESFYSHLTSNNLIRIGHEPPERMEKMFENSTKPSNVARSAEKSNDESWTDELAFDYQQAEETALLEKRQQQSLNHTETKSPSRPPTLASQLQLQAETFFVKSEKKSPSRKSPEVVVSIDNKSRFPTRSTRSRRRLWVDDSIDEDLQKEGDLHGQDEVPEVKFSISHGLGEKWKRPVTFPKIGRQRTTVEFEDLERLDVGEFLNDNLISFYLSWMASKTNLEDKRVYFFNTYFYSSLTNGGKGSRGISYSAVERWTSKDNIFGYDYAVVPINEENHWYVAVICNLTKLGGDASQEPHYPDVVLEKAKDTETDQREGDMPVDEPNSVMDKTEDWPDPEENLPAIDVSPFRSKHDLSGNQSVAGLISPGNAIKNSRKKIKKKHGPYNRINVNQPVIVVLDSLGLTHPKTGRCLKDYLREEYKSKLDQDVDVDSIKCFYAKGNQIPLQSNYCDCGLFLLGYMDKFLVQPRHFVNQLLSGEMKCEDDWPDLDAKAMRHVIRKTLQDLAKEQEDERSQQQAAKMKAKKQPRNQTTESHSNLRSVVNAVDDTQSSVQLLSQDPIQKTSNTGTQLPDNYRILPETDADADMLDKPDDSASLDDIQVPDSQRSPPLNPRSSGYRDTIDRLISGFDQGQPPRDKIVRPQWPSTADTEDDDDIESVSLVS